MPITANETAAAATTRDGLEFFSTTPWPLWKKDKSSEFIHADDARSKLRQIGPGERAAALACRERGLRVIDGRGLRVIDGGRL